MTREPRKELNRRLAASLDALDVTPPPGAEEAAQEHLTARLRRASAHVSCVRPGWLAAASAAVLAMVVVAVPLFMNQGLSFAAVQAHFRDFQTLSMRVEQRLEGRVVQESNMVVNAQGVLRTDVGDEISVLVDPGQGRLLVLQHGSRQAMLMPLEGAMERPDKALDWLAEIREFTGLATRVEGARDIEGRAAYGWALDVAGNQLVLWADGDGLPLAMEIGNATGLEIHYRFEFDAAIAPGTLSSDVPAGYERVGADSR